MIERVWDGIMHPVVAYKVGNEYIIGRKYAESEAKKQGQIVEQVTVYRKWNND